jgi:hypothetical protein
VAHGQEVDVDERAAQRVALDGLGQGEVALGSDLQLEQDVAAGVGAQREAELARVDGQHLRGHAVAVQDGRDPAGGPSAAGRALALLDPGLGSQLVLGHDRTPKERAAQMRVWRVGTAPSRNARR